MERVILHCDANAFYASVECLYTPSIRHRPVAVCGSVEERHGIVLTKNQIAKQFGVQTGEAIWQARQKCPDLICVPPDYALYIRFSRRMRRLYEEYSDRVESFGLDEAWIDLSNPGLTIRDGERIAHEIRLRVGCPVQMTISGVLCTSACVPALRQIVLTQLQMDEIFLTLCGGSVHTHQAEVAQGYVTLPNGCRAGLGGRFFLHPTQGAVLQQLHSVNLRIARRKWITLPEELRSLLEQRLTGVLLIGEPDSGKTTLLRSIAQALAAQDKTVCVIDERREICPGATVPYEQKTMAVDEISGLPKAMAVQMALRTLSPQFILLDELGGTARGEGGFGSTGR